MNSSVISVNLMISSDKGRYELSHRGGAVGPMHRVFCTFTGQIKLLSKSWSAVDVVTVSHAPVVVHKVY